MAKLVHKTTLKKKFKNKKNQNEMLSFEKHINHHDKQKIKGLIWIEVLNICPNSSWQHCHKRQCTVMYSVLSYTALYCTTLNCSVLHCTVLYHDPTIQALFRRLNQPKLPHCDPRTVQYTTTLQQTHQICSTELKMISTLH